MKGIFLLFLFSLTFCAVIDSYIDEKGRTIDHHVGNYIFKANEGSLYEVTYDLEMLGANLIFNLDVVKGLKSLDCDITSVELTLKFDAPNSALDFYKVISSMSKDRYITGLKFNCNIVKSSDLVLVDRVLSAEINKDVVILHTAKGHYEEVFKDGKFDLRRVELPEEEHTKTLCFGVNSNENCDAAKESIHFIKSPYMSLDCTNCFVGAKATVFLSVEIALFKLKHISTGLKDIQVNGAFVMEMLANNGWSGDIDKEYKLVDNAVIMQFWIGPVPISIWFEIPVEIKANAYIDSHAFATIGAKANWHLGDAYVKWENGWTIQKPNPVLTWDHALKSEANFHAETMLSIRPSINVHASRIAHFNVKLEPEIFGKAYGDINKKEVCADLSYKILCQAKAELHINIPAAFIKQDHIYGPVNIIDTGVKEIGHFCHNW